MKFLKRPGFIVTSALLVLLVLSWANVPPFPAISLSFSKTFIQPIYRILRSVDPSLEKENKELRALFQMDAGTRVMEKRGQAQALSVEAMISWSRLRSFPNPIIASVLTRLQDGERSFFLLDKGRRDGVSERSVVVTNKGVLVGRIETVREKTSHLRPLTDPKERFSVRRENGDAPIGVIEGQYEGRSPLLSFAPREEKIERGDLLLTSGLDSGVPTDLLAARVQDIALTDNGSWQTVVVAPLIRPFDLDIVGILVFSE